MDDYVKTRSDNGGVHINSGIPNHAFYLLARELGGRAFETAGPIWYDALQSLGDENASFATWAQRTLACARARFGAGSLAETAARRAWERVGIPL
jgi:Zn-dependent metalloprotease